VNTPLSLRSNNLSPGSALETHHLRSGAVGVATSWVKVTTCQCSLSDSQYAALASCPVSVFRLRAG
jgi:hypothetical protein